MHSLSTQTLSSPKSLASALPLVAGSVGQLMFGISLIVFLVALIVSALQRGGSARPFLWSEQKSGPRLADRFACA